MVGEERFRFGLALEEARAVAVPPSVAWHSLAAVGPRLVGGREVVGQGEGSKASAVAAVALAVVAAALGVDLEEGHQGVGQEVRLEAVPVGVAAACLREAEVGVVRLVWTWVGAGGLHLGGWARWTVQRVEHWPAF